MSADSDRTNGRGEMKSEIQELVTRGFDQKAISSLFYQRALWRHRLEEECQGEPVSPSDEAEI